MTRRARGSFFFVFLLLLPLLLFSPLLNGCGQQATTMDAPTVSDYNKPGTVFIATKFKADVTVNDVTLDDNAITARATQAALTGQTATDEASLLNWFINDLIANPSAYIVPTTSKLNYPDQESDPIAGSGFVITPDGYIVTNAHVVKMDDKELKQTMAISVLSSLVKQEISDIETLLGVKLSDDQANKMAEALATAHATYMTVENTSSKSWMLMGGSASLKDAESGKPAGITKVGEPSPGKDVAILKVDANNLPTVPLGDDTAMREGEQAIAIGYPGAATFNPLIKQSVENIKPSMTTGTISGRKTMEGGWEALQIDTPITHGNSGGPLFNNKGQVIGVTTFGSVNQSSNGATQEVQGFNFAVPVSIVKQFLTEANVTPSEGTVTKTYHEGIDLANGSHYSAAKEKFKEVQDANADYPYVSDQIATDTAKINAGEDKSTFPVPTWLIIIIVIGAIGGAAVALFFIMKNKKKPGMAAAGGPAAATVAPPPVQPAAPPQPEQPAAPPVEAAPPQPEQPAAPPAAEAPTAPIAEEPAPEQAPPAAPEQAQPAAAEQEQASEPPPGFCAYCGTSIPEDAAFCQHCGKEVKR